MALLEALRKELGAESQQVADIDSIGEGEMH